MNTLYLDCSMGAAGDMLFAALLELHPAPQAFLTQLNALALPGVSVSARPSTKCGIVGTHVTVLIGGQEETSEDVPTGAQATHHASHEHGHEHKHKHTHGHGMGDIAHIINGLPLPKAVVQNALAVYSLIAEAESRVHGKPVDKIHFHEVGNLDAIVDVVGVCWLLHELSIGKIIASPIHVGSGQIRCAHGILPVPAPATAEILQGVPCYGGSIKGELCTPTGAALLKFFAHEFGSMPLLQTEKIGYGMGTKDFAAANCVRAFLGKSAGEPTLATEQLWELSCNLDDMTGEDISFACEQLLAAGALDVYTAPIQMKKGRPAVMLCCLCKPCDKDALTQQLLLHTTTLGVRRQVFDRCALERSVKVVQTPHGPVQIKTATGDGIHRQKAEYDDLARIAKAQNITLAEARRVAERCDAFEDAWL